ncbi:MAG TPA: Sec-independent protein translocase protein TatB [Gammaproteobacteria bacterium]|nr:Sec-independent protein translocase protein TatB [Gammaproteobacteria bacterium]
MFDIGFWEIALTGVIALLVVGPERLPGLIREVMRWTSAARRFISGARREF